EVVANLRLDSTVFVIAIDVTKRVGDNEWEPLNYWFLVKRETGLVGWIKLTDTYHPLFMPAAP
ncbi:MAG: hypothetical protein ABIG42_09645, partial [bacterium]